MFIVHGALICQRVRAPNFCDAAAKRGRSERQSCAHFRAENSFWLGMWPARGPSYSFRINPVTPAMNTALSSHPAVICAHR
jgi:hypothetical protein